MNENQAFFEENDREVCHKLVKILVWLTLVFPVLFILSALKVFNIPFKVLGILTPIGCVGTIGPMLALKGGAPVRIMKYVSVLAVGFIVMLLGGQWTIGIYMTYGLAMAFSCLFFDPKFTLKVSIVSYILLVASLYMRSIDIPQIETETNFDWFIGRAQGFLIEQVIMTLVFVNIAKAARKVLVSLHDKEKVTEVVTRCGAASGQLVSMMDELQSTLLQSKEANAKISDSAKNTSEGCEESREQVKQIQDSIIEMTGLIEGIYGHTADMLEVSEKISGQTDELVNSMDIAAGSMKEIEDTSNRTGKSIDDLENGIQEITGFVGQISGISAQTNLLALNASIEAARAGEQGKGFAVVAENVRKLAEDSKKASDAIGELVGRVTEMLGSVKETNDQNAASVMNGIDKIYGAKEKVGSLEEMQKTMVEKTEKIGRRSERTKTHSDTVKDMAMQLDKLVTGFKERAVEIVEEAGSEREITNSTAEAFGRVKSIANELLEISHTEI